MNPAVQRIKEQALGLIADFWKDPAVEFPSFELKLGPKTIKIPNLLKPMAPGEVPPAPPPATVAVASGTSPAVAVVPGAPVPRWHALPGELAEKMWGEGYVLPAGDVILDLLIKPLALTKDKFVLDLTAGLGGPLRRLAAQVHQLKGMESDAGVAARGMELSVKAGKGKQAPIEAYDPTNFSMPAIYHCMIARELFYRIADKGKFFYSIAAGIKERGNVAFTDYIVEPESRAQPAIAAWQAQEKHAHPFGLVEMGEAWAKEGIKIVSSEDQTALYRREIVGGINRFVSALRHAPPPDLETKQAILAEVELWIHRLAAIQQGMKFYCFHAVKT